MSISMLFEKPHMSVPRPAKNTAVRLAPFRPKTLHRRPYNGVNVHVARRNLNKQLHEGQTTHITITYDVPSQLAWFDLLKSDDIDGNTLAGDTNIDIVKKYGPSAHLLVGTKVTDQVETVNDEYRSEIGNHIYDLEPVEASISSKWFNSNPEES